MGDDGYSVSKGGKLKLKGESSSKEKHKKSKKRKSEDVKKDFQLEDEVNHAGGWCVDNFNQIVGHVFIELKEYMYVHGLDNGLFVMGSPHQPGERPDVNELLTAVPIDEKYIAFKSAFGKYMSVNNNGLVIGRSDAIGPREYFEVEFDYDYDGRKVFIKATNGNYLNVNHEGDIVAVADSKTDNDLRIRSLKKREENADKKKLPEEEQSEDLKNVELNYVKKFQKFQDKKIRLCEEDAEDLRKAKDSGVLHEKLLDRREKMKADRYCK